MLQEHKRDVFSPVGEISIDPSFHSSVCQFFILSIYVWLIIYHQTLIPSPFFQMIFQRTARKRPMGWITMGESMWPDQVVPAITGLIPPNKITPTPSWTTSSTTVETLLVIPLTPGVTPVQPGIIVKSLCVINKVVLVQCTLWCITDIYVQEK